MRVFLSFLAAVLLMLAVLFVFSVSIVPRPMPNDIWQPQGFQVVVPSRAVAVSPSPVAVRPPSVAVPPYLKQELSEVSPVHEAKNEVFKCNENGHITYSSMPCAVGAVVGGYNSRRASFTDTSNSISIPRNAAGHYVVQGVADGRALEFMIDTGATDVALPGEFAIGRRIVCEGVGVSRTAGGDVSTCFVTLKRLNVSGMDFYNVRAHIMPTLEGQALFGQSLLNQLKVTQGGGYLTLSR